MKKDEPCALMIYVDWLSCVCGYKEGSRLGASWGFWTRTMVPFIYLELFEGGQVRNDFDGRGGRLLSDGLADRFSLVECLPASTAAPLHW